MHGRLLLHGSNCCMGVGVAAAIVAWQGSSRRCDGAGQKVDLNSIPSEPSDLDERCYHYTYQFLRIWVETYKVSACMPHFFTFLFYLLIRYIIYRITNFIWWGWHYMRGTGGLFSIVHTTCSSCDEAWAGCVYAWIRWSLRLQSVTEVLWPFSPTGAWTCIPHIRGSSRAVSEW